VLVSEIVWFALLVEATQVVLTAAFGLSPSLAIVGSTAVFIYTSLGGRFAVARTDLLQWPDGRRHPVVALRARSRGRG
jgi:Na+/proline symporter